MCNDRNMMVHISLTVAIEKCGYSHMSLIFLSQVCSVAIFKCAGILYYVFNISITGVRRDEKRTINIPETQQDQGDPNMCASCSIHTVFLWVVYCIVLYLLCRRVGECKSD